MKFGNTLRAALALLALACVTAANAQNYDIDIKLLEPGPTPVKQDDPDYPNEGIRRGQEGWVRINFIVNEQGLAH